MLRDQSPVRRASGHGVALMILLRPAKADVVGIAIGEAMIDSSIVSVARSLDALLKQVVVLAVGDRSIGAVRQREEIQQRGSARIDPIGGNPVPRERLPRCRIAN